MRHFAIARSQRTVSVAVGRERDAQYLPILDVVTILLDNAALLDVGITDRTLPVYFPPLDLTDLAKLSSFLTLIVNLPERSARRTELYGDETASTSTPGPVAAAETPSRAWRGVAKS